MGQLNFSNVSEQTKLGILKFLNQAFRAKDILSKELVKNDDGKKDYGIGPVVAGRIIKRRKELPRWRFTELSQLNGIKGFGQDKFEDLVETFSLSSAEQFVYVVKESQEILLENFPLTVHAIHIEDKKEFLETVQDDEKLRNLVVGNIAELATQENLDKKNLKQAQAQLETAYIEKHYTAFIGAYAWALWFFKFDADNWFSFDRIRIPIESYLYEDGDNPSLYLFKGFDNGLIVRGIAVDDLPVVVNHLEQTVYLWTAELFD